MNKLGLFISIFCATLSVNSAMADNPIQKDFGMADPHAYVFEGKLYLFTTRDADPAAKKFIMPDWHIWSTDDMITWTHERTIDPTETYMGKSNDCWATETVYNNGKYYFYFSNRNVNSGVMVADSPAGPYKDALGRPLIDEDLTPTKEYDPSVWVEEDGTAYIVFGHYRINNSELDYHIARLNDDMISLAESPKPIVIDGDINFLKGNDKPNIHKHNGIYYLAAGTDYATSDNIYGPYMRRGSSGNGEYGLNGMGHGNYFKWNNQWFNTWCHFHLGKDVGRFRESYITYMHYRENGEMVSDQVLLDSHFENGVGQYDASWEKIEAEWFMRASQDGLKSDSPSGGFVVSPKQSGDYLCYPNLSSLQSKSKVEFTLKVNGRGVIELREGSVDGRVIGSCKVKGASDGYIAQSVKISPKADKSDIYIIFKGAESGFCNIDSFRFL